MPFLSTGLWRDLVNEREFKAGQADANLPVKFFAHNESGQSVGSSGERSVARIDFSERKRHRKTLSIRHARQRSDPGMVGFWTGLTDHFDFFGH